MMNKPQTRLGESREEKTRLRSGHIPTIRYKWFTRVPVCMPAREQKRGWEPERAEWENPTARVSVCALTSLTTKVPFERGHGKWWVVAWEQQCQISEFPHDVLQPGTEILAGVVNLVRLCHFAMLLLGGIAPPPAPPDEQIQIGMGDHSIHQFYVSETDLRSNSSDFTLMEPGARPNLVW